MEHSEIFQRLGVALAIGLLVGVERGWRERDVRAGGRTAGIRTFVIEELSFGLVLTAFLIRPILTPLLDEAVVQ